MSHLLSELPFISEENIIQLLQKSHHDQLFYQKIGQVFLKINSAPDYENEYSGTTFLSELHKWSRSSRDKSLAEKQHIFKIAEELRRFACDGNKSQALFVRGIGGAGKSDSVKRILQYLSYLDMTFHPEERVFRDFKKPFGSYDNPFYVSLDSSTVSKRIAASITLLESFYTATTDHNLFSSRVSAHYKIRFTLNGKLSGFRVDPLFTDFARCNPKDLHIGPLTIQTLIAHGLPNSNLDHLLIPGSIREQYLTVSGFDYTKQLEHLKEMITVYGGIASDIWENILKVIAAVINLQGIALLGTESAIISSSTKSYIGHVEQLLGLESGTLGPAILKKPDERIGRPAGSLADCKPLEAKHLIELLCAEMIHRTVSFLLNEMAYNFPLSTHETSSDGSFSHSTLHIFDPISWDRNALNQQGTLAMLMNHYCEEKLGTHFLSKAFTEEIDRYLREGITIETVPLPDWSLQLDIIERQPGGLIQILEEGCQNPRAEDKSIADKIILNHNKSKLVKSGGARSKQTVFIIKHSFADIAYDCEGFLIANRYGKLPVALANALKASRIHFLAMEPVEPLHLVEEQKSDTPALKVIRPRPDHKLASPTSFALYHNKVMIESLIHEMNQCEKVHYLICLNLHQFSKSGNPTPVDYLSGQLKSAHVEGLIRLAQSGFAYSRPYHDIYRRFRILLPFSNTSLPLHVNETVEANYQQSCRKLLQECVQLHKLVVKGEDWEKNVTYGHQVCFMKEKFAMMLESYRFNYYEKSNLSCLLLQSIVRMKRWRAQYLVIRKGVIRFQSIVRRHLQRNRFLFLRKSAFWIKSLIIVNYCRKRFVRMSKAATVIKKRLLGKAIQRLRYKRLVRAARSFHSLAKGFIVRRYSQNVYESIRLIQRTAKAFVLRKRIARLRLFSALRIQYNYRGYRTRSLHYNYVQVLKTRKEQRIAQRVVQKLQSLWRRKLVVERFQEIVNAVIVIQRWMKSRLRYQWFRHLKGLVIRLQSQWRRIQATKLVNTLKVATMVQLEKASLSDLYFKETACLQETSWENCVIGESTGGEKGQKETKKLKRLLLTYDFCFDLSFAYSDGWLSSFLDFQRKILQKQHRYITHLAIGNQHTVIVDDYNQIYTMGLGDLGQLGHGHRKSLSYPKKIEKAKTILASGYGVLPNIERKTIVVQVVCGKDHTVLLTSGGLMYSWGDNRRGQLGHSQFESSAFPKVVVSADQKAIKNVTQIGCGLFHSACLAEPGVVYTWGQGDYLGTSPNYRHYNEDLDSTTQKMPDSCCPTILPIFQKKKVIQQLVCGETHCVVLFPGEVYSWGGNQYGQLGN